VNHHHLKLYFYFFCLTFTDIFILFFAFSRSPRTGGICGGPGKPGGGGPGGGGMKPGGGGMHEACGGVKPGGGGMKPGGGSRRGLRERSRSEVMVTRALEP